MEFYPEKDLALCGLACALCSHADCPGCKARGCGEADDCAVYRCATEKGLDGCYQCDAFPCEEKMLQGPRKRAFNRYARRYGKAALLRRLRVNAENGVLYHQPGDITGDYDRLSTEADVLRLLHFGTHDPYARCPELTDGRFTLRLVRMEDAGDLFACYAALRDSEIFTADRYVRDFRYHTIEDMRACIRFWLEEYKNRKYIRFAILDGACGRAIGTAEMFNAAALFTGGGAPGILRLDVAPAYENQADLSQLLSLCVSAFYPLLDVDQAVTLAPPAAEARLRALRDLHFTPFAWPGGERAHYWARR